MPPRKSDASKAATGDEGTPAKEPVAREGINIEDLNLPKSIVTRLAKGVLPPNTQIQGNAMLAMTKSATVFVNYLASHSNEHAGAANRKTITPQDVFNALEDLEFPDFRPRLEAELAKFNEVQTDKRNAYRSKVASNKAAGQAEHGEEGEGETQLDREGQPVAKKARLEAGESSGIDAGANSGEDHHPDEEGEDEGHGDEGEGEDEDEEVDHEERLEVEEPLEDPEEREAADEALDNGEDSD